MASVSDILTVIGPGEILTYAELLERMHDAELDTVAIGGIMSSHRKLFCRSEIVTWQEPLWDEEGEGGWVFGTLYVKRRPRSADEITELDIATEIERMHVDRTLPDDSYIPED